MAEINRVNMEQLLNCALCPNLCRCDCPVLQATGREAVAPSGKARLAALTQQEHLPWSLQILDAVANCLGCRGCTVLCPFSDLNLCDELLFARTGEKGAGFNLPASEPYLNNLKKYSSPYGQKEKVNRKQVAAQGQIIYFPGCTSLANNPDAVEAALYLFEKAGVAVRLMEEDCCGYPAETWGDLELAHQLADENRRRVEESGASLLITGCPECWETFSRRYPAWGQDLPAAVTDAPTYLLQLVEEGRLKPEAEVISRASYHDPCIWARTAEKIKQPRELLSHLPGFSLEEPQHFGKETHCCGGGRMFQLSFPKTAEAIAIRRLAEFKQDLPIVTACPFCREGLLQDERQVFELVEILAISCGFQPG
jgi:Fe-S oxidoreductase